MHCVVHWSIYLALKGLFPTKKRVSFFALMGILGVTLGVMVLIIVQSVMNGLSQKMLEPIAELHGDIRIQGIRGPFPQDEAFLDQILKDPNITQASFFATGPAMIRNFELPTFPVFLGVEDAFLRQLKKYVQQGSLEDLDGDSLMVGRGVARQIGLVQGSSVDVFTPQMLDQMREDSLAFPESLDIVGIFETGFSQIDNQIVLCSLPTLQRLYGLEASVHGLILRLNDKREAALMQTVQRLNEQFRTRMPLSEAFPLSAYPWTHQAYELLSMLKTEKITFFFILIFIIMVASFAIAVALSLSVIRKRREIALLRSLGASKLEAALSFCIQGLVIGILGFISGTTLGLLVLYFRNPIANTLARFTHSEDALRIYYSDGGIPVHYVWEDFAYTGLLALLLCSLAGFFPAIQAMRIPAAQSLRSED